ncbi:tetratricopeptide repeat protein [Mucilaginibacter pocheonensis]|uniref:Tetratricopeptide (TPR) repeat protein n=1 Tax=Mucilaginibacter pocheonensis TaxID=398050 RepID=A0ABU1TBU8_9SPHI|nr:tetratricopeptide repeat protein [Mucilaginibacter pocheonensis]MDR6942853.1 tetratricopeptide (TPR) repeat protein [Mucilaginibacter pocheonensis]
MNYRERGYGKRKNNAGKYYAAVIFCLLSLTFSLQASAQRPAKPMSALDSIMVKQLFFSALREKTIENTKLATEMFERVLQTDPANDASMYELANLKKLQNDYAGAQPLLEKAVAVKPDNEWYWAALADSYEKSNSIVKLENVFNQLIRINPDKPDYYFDKANAYVILKRYDDALKVYNQLEQLTGPSDDILASRQKIYLKQGRVDQAAAELEKAIADNPGQTRYYLLLAEIYNSNNFGDKALKVLQQAEKQDSNNGMVHLALADIYRDKKNIDAAFNELTLAFSIPDVSIDQKIRIIGGYFPKFPEPNAKASALELSRILTVAHPADSKAYAMYGDMLAQNAKYKEAAAAYKKSIELNEQVYIVHEQLVRIELSQNDIDATIKDGENALSLFPNQGWMNYMVGVAWAQKKDSKKALGYAKNATSLEIQDKDLLSLSFSLLGDCYHDLKDSKSSDAAYDKALSYNPDNAYTLNNYAYYLSLRNEALDKAAQMSARSNELQPNTASFEDTYAWVLFKQKKYTEAKVWMEKALAHDKDNSSAKYEHYGDILYYLGNTDAAVQNWKKAKEHGGQSPVLERKINEKKYSE